MNRNIAPPQLLNVEALSSFLEEVHGYDLYSVAPPVDVDTIAELLGILVSDAPKFAIEDINTIGKITLEKNEPARVWINPMENSYLPRRRFTLAHEIGHFCMHRSTNQTTFVDTKSTMNRSESYWNRSESEANNFAAELLMPADLVRSVGREIINAFKSESNVEKMPIAQFSEKMAIRFKVSNPAMEYRLKNIGIRGSKPS